MIEELRRRIEGEEFDYQVLLDSLKGYERPRDKITSLIRQDAIVRVKKGIYLFGQKYARRPFSREILANMIYGPSCVSLDYALHYHGLIPEGVEAVTSVTSGRGRRFSTPVGLFIYRTVPMGAYSVGIDQVQLEGGRSFLMAVPKGPGRQDPRRSGDRRPKSKRDEAICWKALRIDEETLGKLNADTIIILAEHYRSRKLRLLAYSAV